MAPATPSATTNPAGGNNIFSQLFGGGQQQQPAQAATPAPVFDNKSENENQNFKVIPKIPITPEKIIGFYNQPIVIPQIPPFKVDGIKATKPKNKTISAYLKSIERKMDLTEKLLKNLLKFQNLQITQEKILNDRKRDLYSNTFQEFLLDKTIDFRDKDKEQDCTCVNLPKTSPSLPIPPGLPSGQPEPARAPSRVPSTVPVPSPVPSTQPSTQTQPGTQPGTQPYPPGTELPGMPPVPPPVIPPPKRTPPPTRQPAPTPTPIPEGREPEFTPEEIPQGTPPFPGPKIPDWVITGILGVLTAAAIISPVDAVAGDAVAITALLARLISTGAMSRAAVGALLRRFLTKKATEELLKQIDKLVTTPTPKLSPVSARPNTPTTANTDIASIIKPQNTLTETYNKFDIGQNTKQGAAENTTNFDFINKLNTAPDINNQQLASRASGGVKDIELHDASSMNFFRYMSGTANFAGGGLLDMAMKVINNFLPKPTKQKGLRGAPLKRIMHGTKAGVPDLIRSGGFKGQTGMLGKGVYGSVKGWVADTYRGAGAFKGIFPGQGPRLDLLVPQAAKTLRGATVVSERQANRGLRIAEGILSGRYTGAKAQSLLPLLVKETPTMGQAFLRSLSPLVKLGSKALPLLNAPVIGDALFPEPTQQYDQLTGPNAAYNNPTLSKTQAAAMRASMLETSQTALTTTNQKVTAPAVIPLPPIDMRVPVKKPPKRDASTAPPVGVDIPNSNVPLISRKTTGASWSSF